MEHPVEDDEPGHARTVICASPMSLLRGVRYHGNPLACWTSVGSLTAMTHVDRPCLFTRLTVLYAFVFWILVWHR